MDGVLVDFLGRCWDTQCFNANGSPNLNKAREIGPDFWYGMDWIYGVDDNGAPYSSKDFLHDTEQLCRENNIEVGILTAIQFKEGRYGKIMWMHQYAPEFDNNHIIIVPHGVAKGPNRNYHIKSDYANPSCLLIDDRKENTDDFAAHGGQTILFSSPYQAITELRNLICPQNKY